MREAYKKKSKFHVKMHCKMNWKGASLGVCSRGARALFHKFHFLQSLFLLLPFFFFHYFRCLFWHPFLCSVLMPHAHFQPLWRTLIRSDFFTFLWIFWCPFLISVCYHSFQFRYNFCRPMIPFLFLIWL